MKRYRVAEDFANFVKPKRGLKKVKAIFFGRFEDFEDEGVKLPRI